MENINESIIKKIKGLLAIANDHKSDEESQSAFVLAQKLMIKHNISMAAIEDVSHKNNIQKEQVTVYKKLFWWEKKLASIIANNFRVKSYLNMQKVNGGQRKTAVMFFGFDGDVELAKEMYILAYDALKVYSERFSEEFYKANGYYRERSLTFKIKDSYIRGFLEGMGAKFKEQVSSMQQEYGVMVLVLVPKEVEEGFAEFKNSFERSTPFKIPPIEEIVAYRKGYSEGNEIDYTKSTIDDTIFEETY